MGNELPYMPTFIGDFMTAVAIWPPERVGAYWLALMFAWEHNGVPADDDTELAAVLHMRSIAQARRLWGEIAYKFRRGNDGRYRNDKQEEVRADATRRHALKTNRAHRGAAARWNKEMPPPIDPLLHTRDRHRRMLGAKEQGTHTKAEWLAMLELYRRRCLRCGSDEHPVERDHVLAIYKGGSDSIANIQPLCAHCNAAKGGDEIDYRVGQPETPSDWVEWCLSIQGEMLEHPVSNTNQIQTHQLPPQPPAGAGGRVTRRDRKDAENRLRGWFDAERRVRTLESTCPHDLPRCATWVDCIEREAMEGHLLQRVG